LKAEGIRRAGLYWKSILAILVTIVVLAVLAPAPEAETHYPGRIPVVFWHQFAGEWQPIYEGMVERFNKSQTKYEVIPVSVPGDACTTKFLMSSAGGDTPDILLDWDPVLGMWADKGLIRPFDDLMTPDEKREWLARTYPIIKRNSTYHGKIMAMVDGLDLFAIYYRLDHLKEVGVDKNHLPKTMEELVALGKKLDRYDDQHHLRRVGFLPKGFSQYAAAFNGNFNDNGRIVVNNPGNLAAMKFLDETNRRLGYDAVTHFTSSLAADAGPTIPLIAGNFSILYDGEWRVKQVEQYAKDLPYLLAPLPPPKGGRPSASISNPNYLMIPTAAKHPDGAWAFAKFCVGFLYPEDGGRNMGEMGWLPNDPVIARSKSYQEYLKHYPRYKVFVDLMSSPNLEIQPQGQLQKFAMDEMAKADDAVARGSATPEQALKTVDDNLNAERERLRKFGQPAGD